MTLILSNGAVTLSAGKLIGPKGFETSGAPTCWILVGQESKPE